LVRPARDAATERQRKGSRLIGKGRNAARSLPFVVRIEKKPECSFGSTMNDIRTWLDHRGIDVLSFKPVAKADTGAGFKIAFRTEDEAHLFESEFA
jgi:hypothetical protein